MLVSWVLESEMGWEKEYNADHVILARTVVTLDLPYLGHSIGQHSYSPGAEAL